MNVDDVRERLEKELEIPSFSGRLEDKKYTEEEYQELKRSVEYYFDEYVRNVEN